mmetsp:Transcript_33742/g.30587  ORF Transcript_33742/g.30587 Transcript_33742/m.30587 type:complete len:246 (-) Transcript_33742:258-995(-)
MAITLVTTSDRFAQPAYVTLGMINGLMIGESLIDPFVNILLDIDYYIYLIGRSSAVKAAENGEIGQRELNAAYEFPEFSYVAAYSNAFVLLLLSFTFSPVIPHCTLISIIGLCNLYITDKYIITRRSSHYKDLSGELSFKMISNMEILIIVYVISDYVWDIFYVDERTLVDNAQRGWVTAIILLICIIYFFFPFHWLVKEATSSNKVKKSSKTYDDLEQSITSEQNYEKQNPVYNLEILRADYLP